MKYKYLLYRPCKDIKTGLPGFEKVSSHASYPALQRAFAKKKVDDSKIFMVVIPTDAEIGTKLYAPNGTPEGRFYGIISGTTEYFYEVKRPEITIADIPPQRIEKVKHIKDGRAKDGYRSEVEIVVEPISFPNKAMEDNYIKERNKPVMFPKHIWEDYYIQGAAGKEPGFIVPKDQLPTK